MPFWEFIGILWVTLPYQVSFLRVKIVTVTLIFGSSFYLYYKDVYGVYYIVTDIQGMGGYMNTDRVKRGRCLSTTHPCEWKSLWFFIPLLRLIHHSRTK